MCVERRDQSEVHAVLNVKLMQFSLLEPIPICVPVCVHVCATPLYSMCLYCTAGGECVSTLLDAGRSGHVAATREGIEAELRSLRSKGEVPAGTTRDKVGMHWSESWCRHETWTSGGIEISSRLAPLWSG